MIYAQIGFSTNSQTFNNNIAAVEKSRILKNGVLLSNINFIYL